MKYLTLTLFALLAIVCLNAQDISYERITNRDGLSQNDVIDVFQDSFGFLWIGTNDGLNRYDGNDFKIYRKTQNGLSSGIIVNIAEDNKQNLWVSTIDQGINRIDLKTGKVESFLFGGEKGKSLIGNDITELECDKNGVVWYATSTGIGKIVPEDGNFRCEKVRMFPNKKWGNKTKIFIDNQDNVWCLASEKISLIDDNGFNVIFEEKDVDFREMIQFGSGYAIAASEGLFYATMNDLRSPDFVPAYNGVSGIASLMAENETTIWCVSSGLHRFQFNAIKKTFERIEISKNIKQRKLFGDFKPRVICKERNGILYLGTNGSGLIKFNTAQKKFKTFVFKENDDNLKVRSVFEDSKGNLYFGMQNSVLQFLPASEKDNYESGRIEEEKLVNPNNGNAFPVFTINEVNVAKGQKSIIAGTDFRIGFKTISGVDLGFPELGGRVFAIKQTRNGLVWLGTYSNGLYRFDPSGNLPFKHFTEIDGKGLLSDIIRSFEVDSKGRLWIGTSKGLNVLLKKEQIKEEPKFIGFKHDHSDETSLSYNYILPIYESEVGDLWVGTLGGGLNRLLKFDRGGKAQFENFTIDDGLPNDVIKAIVEDDEGNLWISTNHGLSRFNPRKKQFDNFDMNDGLQDNEFSELAACKRKSGEMIFGGVNGINVFYPEDIAVDTSESVPVFTDLTILNKKVNVGEEINNHVVLSEDINLVDQLVLRSGENSFSVHFASINYNLPAKNKCKYRLQGFEEEWVNVNTGEEAKYTNLKPGDYTLQLMAANSDGYWSSEVKELNIKIKPPIYLTNVAKVFYIIIVFLLLIFFRKYSIIEVNRKHDLVIRDMKKQKDEEVIQAKLRFFTNISHEFKTPLTLIINPLQQLIKKDQLPPENVLREFHSIMYRNANVLMRLINQLLEFRKLEQGKMKLKVAQGDLKAFLKEIHQAFMPLAESKDIKLQFNYHYLGENLFFDHDKLEKVLFNLLSNAIKFTPEGGDVRLDLVDSNEKYISIMVSDTGIGMEDDVKHKIFDRFYQANSGKEKSGTGIGLAYSRNLVEVMKGKIDMKSQKGQGTTFYISLPKQKAVFSEDEVLTDEFVAPEIDKSIFITDVATPEMEKSKVTMEGEDLCTLLIVEDNNDLRNFLNNFFSVQFNVLEAANGKVGFEMCQQYIPDIVISDVAMPEMDGFELTKKIKNTFETSHIPVVLLTARTTDDQQQAGLNAGADMYVNKPFNAETLLSRVLSIIKNRQRLKSKYREKINVNPSEISPSNRDEKFIQKSLSIVEEHIADPDFSVQKLAAEVGMSQTTLNKKLLAITGQKAKIFIRTIRLKRAAQLLKLGEMSVSEITYGVGFSDLQYFRKCFVAEFNCLPSEYVKQNDDSQPE